MRKLQHTNRLHPKLTQRLMLAFAVMVVGIAASCDGMHFGKIDFEYTGRVLDKDTNQPIEGAYVMAAYEDSESGWHGPVTWCVKTAGMTTGKDGKFNFTIDKLDHKSPARVYVIAPHYYEHSQRAVHPDVQRAQRKEAYADRDVYMKKQDPKDPKFGSGYMCNPRLNQLTRGHVQANIEFMKLELIEYARYRELLPRYQTYVESTSDLISSLQSKTSQ